ncbi:MAG: serine hydrolase domain-containing protein [Chthoniobacteraceae bacterium]
MAFLATPVLAALRQERLDEAVEVLARAAAEGQITTAVLHVVQRDAVFSRSFGKAQNEHAMFLLGSISKPICVSALMTLFERDGFTLDDPLTKFIPRFTGGSADLCER